MSKKPSVTTGRHSSSAAIFALPLLLAACGATEPEVEASASPEAAESMAEARGAQIWSTTCNRCHNARLPNEYNAEQWSLIVSHMRTRAHLTRSEAADVTAFLQSMVE